ncbi:hypothetical protein MBLNU459_g5204t2 [Dothideomycetes sp. NU459]
MAFAKGMQDRPESLLFRAHQSPREESPFPTFTSPLSPLRQLSSRVNASVLASGEGRGGLQRRFTTNALPTLSPIGQQRLQAAEPSSEKKARQYEELLAQQRRIQAQMAMIDPETRREVDEHQRLEQDITMYTTGHQSEPNTPPEYYSTVSNVATRPNRFSTSSLTSPPGLHARHNRSGSQLTSPPVTYTRPFTSHATYTIPSKSMPASRRGSDEEEEDYNYGPVDPEHRKAANYFSLNRNSMPVKMGDLSSMLGSVNTTSFLFADDDDHKSTRQVQNPAASPDAKTYLQLHANDDKFPILVRQQGDGNVQLSASSAALDLALSQSPGPENQPITDRATAARHRQSLPPSSLRQPAYLTGENAMSPLNGILTDLNTAKNTAANRRSVEVKFSGIGETVPKRPGLLVSPKPGSANGFPKLQSSYSTNDIPTLKSTNATSFPVDNNSAAVQTPRYDYASPEHQDAALLNSSVSPGIHRSLQPEQEKTEPTAAGYLAQRSALQASAAPFGPTPASSVGDLGSSVNALASAPMPPYGNPAYYAGYGMQMLNAGFNNMYVGQNQGQWPAQNGQVPMYQGPFGGYSQYPQPPASRFPDNQTRAVQQRRAQNGEDNARFANVKLEALSGEIYGLCKDQHGCRYLQKKLEDRATEHIQLIFDETNTHVVELMTDPFGNYLCQKLLEYCNDDQRTVLIRNAAPQMVKIAVNQHGTRALQKMIEFISTREQIQIIIEALQFEVVHLIQDLNGNHVIQKCLNHLSPEDAQFIFDAVGTNCVVVGTHRHGCCVLQRCIDHASGLQKGQLIQHITMNAFALVQDPFGNYVVQYILDLGEPSFSEPLCRTFCGSVALLSRQKFSSNVIEKCIRTAEDDTKRVLIEELISPLELEKLLRDSFANYVVQTAMDYADPETKARLVDSIRPIIPSIRHTPYGRRIGGKIQDYDGRGAVGGTLSPAESLSPGQVSNTSFSRSNGPKSMNGFSTPSSTMSNGGGYMSGNMASPTQRSVAHASLNMVAQSNQQFQQGYPGFGRGSRPTGMTHY